MSTYYDVLGVARTATPEQLRAGYLAQVRAVHPDRAQGEAAKAAATAKTQLVTEAYAVLRDAVRRASYDRTLPPLVTPSAYERSRPTSAGGTRTPGRGRIHHPGSAYESAYPGPGQPTAGASQPHTGPRPTAAQKPSPARPKEPAGPGRKQTVGIGDRAELILVAALVHASKRVPSPTRVADPAAVLAQHQKRALKEIAISAGVAAKATTSAEAPRMVAVEALSRAMRFAVSVHGDDAALRGHLDYLAALTATAQDYLSRSIAPTKYGTTWAWGRQQHPEHRQHEQRRESAGPSPAASATRGKSATTSASTHRPKKASAAERVRAVGIGTLWTIAYAAVGLSTVSSIVLYSMK